MTNVTQLPQLTDAMRFWLDSWDRRILVKDFVMAFLRHFELEHDPRIAGRLIAQWIREKT